MDLLKFIACTVCLNMKLKTMNKLFIIAKIAFKNDKLYSSIN